MEEGICMKENCGQWEELISRVWEKREELKSPDIQAKIFEVIRALESGEVRVMGPAGKKANCGSEPLTGDLRTWQVFPWVKQSILLLFQIRSSQPIGVVEKAESLDQGRIHGSYMSFFDKLDVRNDLGKRGVRIVPPGVVREGAYVAPGCIVMPGYVNIGAYVDSGSMVDTWATVGSCAQVGKNVHLSGGVGLGGVLEPAGARPVMVGDNAFIGSRSIVVEGAVVSEGAVIGANVCVTSSTPIYDVTEKEVKEHRGFVPARAVVVPGTRKKTFPGGEVDLQCAYIIAYRNASTDSKTSLNQILRETGISV